MKILFVHNYLATFTRIDLDILRSQHTVYEVYVRHNSLRSLLRSTWEVVKGALWCDLVFAWFGAFHALLPFLLAKLFGKKCVVVASGYDVANEPAIDYGNMRPGPLRLIGRWVFSLADNILAVSQFAAAQALANAGVRQSRLRVIVHGIPAINPSPDGVGADKQQLVLTVGSINEPNLTLKGLLHFAELASCFPDVEFAAVGPTEAKAVERMRWRASPNLSVVGPLYGADLWEYMRKAKVYVQLSAYESFGMAVAEAMTAGCVPVVTDRGALPEVVGDIGFVVPYGDLEAMAQATLKAMTCDESIRLAARERIVTCFSLEQRRKALLQAVQDIVPSTK